MNSIPAYTLETFPGVGQGKNVLPFDYERMQRRYHQKQQPEKKDLKFTTKALWEEYIAKLESKQKTIVKFPPQLETIECVDLDLSHSDLTDEHIIPLAELIAEQGQTTGGKKIRKLYLVGNAIRLKGAEALAKAFKINTYVGARSPIYFNCSDESNQYKTMVDLTYNPYGEEGCMILAEALFSTGRSAWSCALTAHDITVKELHENPSNWDKIKSLQHSSTFEQNSWIQLQKEQLQRISEIEEKRPVGSILK